MRTEGSVADSVSFTLFAFDLPWVLSLVCVACLFGEESINLCSVLKYANISISKNSIFFHYVPSNRCNKKDKNTTTEHKQHHYFGG